MNKLTKLGASALCGSLAAIASANAGDMSVTGGVDMSWVSLEDSTTGNPIGIGSNLNFNGTGELDNGWTVAYWVGTNNAMNYSAANVTVTIPAIGDLRISQGVSGSGIDRIDDITPNVWEEAYATGLGTGINTVAGVSGAANIEWTPNMLPEGLGARISYTPDADGSKSADKGTSGDDANLKSGGYDVTVSLGESFTGVTGFTIDAGMSKTEKETDDISEETIAVTYAVGPVTLGYQWSREDLGTSSAALQYDNKGYGITFNVNDDLSIGYNNYESEQDNATDVTAEAASLQIAYTMGGASIRLAQASIDNAKYQTTTDFDRDATTLSVSLAF